MQTTLRWMSMATLLAACGGAAATEPAQQPEAEHHAASPSPTAATSAPSPRDPKLADMAKAARACAQGDKVYDFDSDCSGYKAWRDSDAFADGKGDDTVFSLLGDPDPRFHYLAFSKTIQPAYWKDPAHAKALFALVRSETVDDVLRKLADYVALVDADAAGLGSELKSLAKHPSASFRKELASEIVRRSQSTVALEVEQLLLADSDKDVKESAIFALAADGTLASDPVCQLLTQQITRADDDLYAAGIDAAMSSACPGLRDKALGELEKRVADPTKVGMHAGALFARALGARCMHADVPDKDKKHLFALGAKLVDPKVPDSMIRERAVDTLFLCDWASLEKMLPKLRKDTQIADHLKTVEAGIKDRKTNKK
jgi:hypothetical protein